MASPLRTAPATLLDAGTLRSSGGPRPQHKVQPGLGLGDLVEDLGCQFHLVGKGGVHAGHSKQNGPVHDDRERPALTVCVNQHPQVFGRCAQFVRGGRGDTGVAGVEERAELPRVVAC
jgi:hypothetical protein